MYFFHTVQKVISRAGSRALQRFIDFKTQTNFLIFFLFAVFLCNHLHVFNQFTFKVS
jgi:cytosine/uracil/thiamine/allantoin permease